MPDTGNAKDCLELPPTNFSIFTLKNVTWRTYLIIFSVQYCFLFRFVCIELVSLIWFRQFWVAIYVYGTMIKLVHFDKEISANVIVSGTILNVSTDHFNGIWHLVWLYLSKPVLGGHPVLSEHYSIPKGCPLNTGFTVVESTSGHGEKNPGFWLAIWPGEMVPSCPLGIPRVGPARQSNVSDHILNPSLTKLVRSRVSLVDNWEATNFKKLRARKIKQIRNFRVGFGYAT